MTRFMNIYCVSKTKGLDDCSRVRSRNKKHDLYAILDMYSLFYKGFSVKVILNGIIRARIKRLKLIMTDFGR